MDCEHEKRYNNAFDLSKSITEDFLSRTRRFTVCAKPFLCYNFTVVIIFIQQMRRESRFYDGLIIMESFFNRCVEIVRAFNTARMEI